MIQGIYHIGIQADDPMKLAAFYRHVLDMQVVGGSEDDSPFGTSAFLSSRPDEESHHLAIFQNRQFAHVAFKVGTVAEFAIAGWLSAGFRSSLPSTTASRSRSTSTIPQAT